MVLTMNGFRWIAAMVLAAAATHADEQQVASQRQSDFVLPRLTPAVQ